jgi:hypothetical protein
MQRLAPVEHDGLFEGKAEEIEIGLVGERAGAVELGHPDRHRRAVGDQPKALLAFPQDSLRQHLIGDVEIGADQALCPAVAAALDPGNDADPSDLAVTGPDDGARARSLPDVAAAARPRLSRGERWWGPEGSWRRQSLVLNFTQQEPALPAVIWSWCRRGSYRPCGTRRPARHPQNKTSGPVR